MKFETNNAHGGVEFILPERIPVDCSEKLFQRGRANVKNKKSLEPCLDIPNHSKMALWNLQSFVRFLSLSLDKTDIKTKFVLTLRASNLTNNTSCLNVAFCNLLTNSFCLLLFQIPGGYINKMTYQNQNR